MSIIRTVVDFINATIKQKVLTSPAFEFARLRNICYPMPEVVDNGTMIKIVPTNIGNDSEGEIIDLDEDFPILIYHRIVNKSYQLEQKQAKSFGDGYNQNCTADMYMIVCADRGIVNCQADELEELIIRSLPVNLKIGAVKRCILAPYQSDLDFIKIFKQEFQQVQYFLKPEQILFQIKYKLQVDTDTNCTI
ncbi:hypothetical protein QTN47_17080 [Danxiaibacter flavus]|uniref:Uncharacterized protein n=1 Tax=Danxiaibacter flavus TaxID=3049108 RepID=A0ABV3ZH49_9BACT|nr:hypothetical protein QNM32_17090 [Chitinophagaceae bacterium DXS]